MTPKAKPGGNRASRAAGREYLIAHGQLYGTPGAYIPANFRERVAAIAGSYFRQRLHKLGKPNASGWAACCCPLHADKHASASVNLITGGFRCHGCGEHGDLIALHQRLTGLPFKSAVRDLLGLPS